MSEMRLKALCNSGKEETADQEKLTTHLLRMYLDLLIRYTQKQDIMVSMIEGHHYNVIHTEEMFC